MKEKQSANFGKVRKPKNVTLIFRVGENQKEIWFKALKELQVEDFSTYARAAVERSIYQDFRSKDPGFQNFLNAIQPTAREMLGEDFSEAPVNKIPFFLANRYLAVLKNERLKK